MTRKQKLHRSCSRTPKKAHQQKQFSVQQLKGGDCFNEILYPLSHSLNIVPRTIKYIVEKDKITPKELN